MSLYKKILQISLSMLLLSAVLVFGLDIVGNQAVDDTINPQSQPHYCGMDTIATNQTLSIETLSTEPTGSLDNNLVSHQQRRLDPARISFLNWNIYKGNSQGWQQDLIHLAGQHDVMAIQEALLDDVLYSLLEDVGHNWSMNTAFHFKDRAAGVMTTSSASTNDSCGFIVSEPVIRVPKAVLISYHAIEGHDERLLVANIHSINFTLGIRSYHTQLQQLHDAISHHDGPMIVAGDFNSWSDRRMREVEQIVSRLSLERIEYDHPYRTQVFGNAIDHVFYRQLEIVEHRVWRVNSSDHNPISVDFRYLPATTI